MKRTITLVGLFALLIPGFADAELRDMRQTIFGMD
jgi:hypothetical protein